MKNVVSPLVIGTALLVGCGTTESLLEDARYQTGSRTMVADADYDELYSVNIDEGSMSANDTNGGDPVLLEFGEGSEPTRIARVGDTLYVTLRGTGEVAVVRDTGSGIEEVGERIAVGCEPFGIVAREDGSALYVTVSQDNKVVQIDPASNTVVGETPVGNDPRWIALHPEGKQLYIGSARGSLVQTMGLEEDGSPNGTVDVVPLPGTGRTVGGDWFEPTVRVIGDLAVSPAGDELLVPSIYVDNHSQQVGLGPGDDPTLAYYVNPQPGVGRFNSAIVKVPLASNGEANADAAAAVFLAGFVQGDFTLETIRSYPNSVSISPDGLHYAVSMESSDAVVMVGKLAFDRAAQDSAWIEAPADARPDEHGYERHPQTTIELRQGSGPRGVAWMSKDEAWVHDWMNVSVTDLSPKSAMKKTSQRGMAGLDDTESFGARANLRVEMPRDLTVFNNGSAEANELKSGRQLFYGARNTDMAIAGAGVACATCHSEGRDDGLTWQLGPERRQTPSLAGVVSETHPVTWTANVESVAAEAQLTSTIRMGGANLTGADYDDIQAFVDWTRPVILPERNITDPRIALGEEVFHREEVGCATCHDPTNAFSDGDHHDMYGLQAVNTPTLYGISTTAPYLHDGRAETLRDVLELSRTGEMGDTSTLSNDEMDALEAYLKSL